MKKILLFITLINFSFTQAQIVNIPDANFKSALLSLNPAIDTNNDNEIQVVEAEAYTSTIDVDAKNIFDLTGIEAFTNITRLSCTNNHLSSIDLSNNIHLTWLHCYLNNLTELDVSNNTALTTLMCPSLELESLDLSNNILLTHLGCTYNRLTELDLQYNTSLQFIYCNSNEISELDLSNNPDLRVLNINDNNISNIDLTNNSALIQLNCSNNDFTNINISNNPILHTIKCNDNSNLITLNLKNGNNINFSNTCNYENLPALQTVCIDEMSNTGFIDYINSDVGHSIVFDENCTLSLNSNEIFDFSVYPIPTENILNIKLETKIIQIDIYNKLGQLVIKNTMKNKIDISNLAQGLYFVKAKDSNENFGVKKFIKN